MKMIQKYSWRWIGVVLALCAGTDHASAAPIDPLATERNLAVANFQNEDPALAAPHFEKAVRLSPDTIQDRINWGLSALQARYHEQAMDILTEVLKRDPNLPQALYLAGIANGRLLKYGDAADYFQKLLGIDPTCAPAEYNLGLALKRLDRTGEAATHFEKTTRINPNHTAAYFQLYTHYIGVGDSTRAKRAFAEFTRTKEKGVGPGTSQDDVEKSKYLELIPYALRSEPGRADEIDVRFHDATSAFGLNSVVGSEAAASADLDGNGNLDVLLGNRIFRNNSGKFRDVTEKSGFSVGANARCLAAFDFNGDGKLDIVACDGHRLALFKGKGGFIYEDVSGRAGLEKPCDAAMEPAQVRAVDFDHEGDLDLIVSCVSRTSPIQGKVVLLRNNGNDTFTDVTAASHFTTEGGVPLDLLLADFDAKNDIDFFFPLADGKHRIFLNQRDGSFKETAADAGLSNVGTVRAAFNADVDGDGVSDLIFLSDNGKASVYLNHGDGRFGTDTAPDMLAQSGAVIDAKSGALVDADNDGSLDLFLAGGSQGRGMALFRNDLRGGWVDGSNHAFGNLKSNPAVRKILHADFDGDGDQDLLLVVPGGPVTLLRNDGGNRNRVVRVKLSGQKNSMDGYGSKVWVKDGGFYVLRETFDQWTDIGIGHRKTVQVLGVRWPTGITQNQLNLKTSKKTILDIVERPGLAESCPFLYTFDGERFRFVTDFLDTTPLGIQLAPGAPFQPNHREAFLIGSGKLKARGGVLSTRITQELKEITYLDRVRLYAVDHPKGAFVFPNDRFSDPPFAPFKIHVLSDPFPPVHAVNARGEDIRSKLARADRIYAFESPPVRANYPGIWPRHDLILDPGEAKGTGSFFLVLRGTTLWTDASVNFAVAQNPDVKLTPVSLDVIGKDGSWRRVRDDLGVPAGVDKFLPVDLTGVLETEDHRVRISTNFAILWDQAIFGFEAKGGFTTTMLVPTKADLHSRGFSTPFSPDGKLPDFFDYDRLLSIPPFELTHGGRYTRYGDVLDLLQEADDRYVILAPGDEVAADFSEDSLPSVPTGWMRDYIFDSDGWIKDADFRTASFDSVDPYPFRRMSSYPYSKNEAFPDPSGAFEKFQTRVLETREHMNGRGL